MKTPIISRYRPTKSEFCWFSVIALLLLLMPTADDRFQIVAYFSSFATIAIILYFFMPKRFRYRGTVGHLNQSRTSLIPDDGWRLSSSEAAFIGVSKEMLLEALSAEQFTQEAHQDQSSPFWTAKKEDYEFRFLTQTHQFRWLFTNHTVIKTTFRINRSSIIREFRIIQKLQRRLNEINKSDKFPCDSEMTTYGKHLDFERAINISGIFCALTKFLAP